VFVIAVAVCSLAPGLAQARPRDEVMAGAFRCATIGDSRLWLDCYYGAAQPARASLGLPPVSAARVQLVRSPPSGTPVDVEIRDTVISGAFRCNSFADDRQWLDCYYGAAQPMRARLGLPPAPQAQMASLSPPAAPVDMPAPAPPPPRRSGGWFSGIFGGGDAQKVSPQQFGMSVPAAAPKKADHVTSRMESYSFDRYGIFTATLANGQVWRQLSGDTSYAHWKKPAGSYVVNISRGWMGSYNFEVKNNPGMFKVSRIR
jgi:hypothetical protein